MILCGQARKYLEMVDVKNQKLKVCFAASSGGHLEELMVLRPLMARYDSFIVTERTRYDAVGPGKWTVIRV